MDSRKNDSAGVPDGQEIFNRVFVGGLARDTSELELENFFSNFGDVVDVRIVCDRKTGLNKGYGFVTFGDAIVRDSLVQKGTVEYKGGRKLRLRRAVKKETGGQFFATANGTQNGVVGNQIILVPTTESVYTNPVCYQAPQPVNNVNYIQMAQQYNCCYPAAGAATHILYGYNYYY